MKFSSSGLLLLVVKVHNVVSAQSLPMVDLGYEIHQALVYNEAYQTYNFSNIRYAQNPIGNLRFNLPAAPTGRNTQVQTGSVGRICPQARPNWSYVAQQWTRSLIQGTPFNYDEAVAKANALLAANPPKPDPRTTEDCLFLDVVVPKAVWDNGGAVRNRTSKGAPVIIWIYGGGFTQGAKDDYAPNGLIKASQKEGSDGAIFVAMNYRLGALGWLAGASLHDAGGVSNAGLYDQKLAIEWVTKYINLFGGNPKDITLLGESAGGASIMHHITSYGGQGMISFQKAILQSPGFLPQPSQFQQEMTTQAFLRTLNVTTIAAARALSSEVIIQGNTKQVGNSPYSTYTFGPVVDGGYVTTLPGLALQAGNFHKYVSLVLGHNSNEAPAFTPPLVRDDASLSAFLTTIFPGIRQPVVDYIVHTLYPFPGANVTTPYSTGIERTILLISEAIFTCNTNYLARGFSYMTRNYEFAVPPGFHGQDIPYTFSNDRPTDPSVGFYKPVADNLQGYITNFARKGDPNGPQVPWFPIQGMNASENVLKPAGVTYERDPTVNPRCRWWQRAMYS